MDRCDRCLTSDVEGRLKSTILTTGPCHYPGKYTINV
jgi:hypothetical protein